MLIVTKTREGIAAQLHRLLHRRGQGPPKKVVGGVECFIAGNMVRPVSAPSAEYMPHHEAMQLVVIVDDIYHREQCGHWADIPYGRAMFGTYVEAVARGLRPCRP